VDEFTIEGPCDADWDAMTPTGPATRHCARCAEDVVDVASLTPEDAAAVGRDRSRCLRVSRMADGRIVTLGGALLAATLMLAPAPAEAGPSPLLNPSPTPAQLERGRAQARRNVVQIRGTIEKRAPIVVDHEALLSPPDEGMHRLIGRRGP